MPWTLDLKSLDGTTTTHSATPFKSGRLTWALDGPGAAEFELRASDVADGRWTPGTKRLLVKNAAGTAQFQGWLERLERSEGEKMPGVTTVSDWRAAGRGLAAHLDERVVHGDFNQVGVTRTTAARALITHIDSQTDDAANFTLGSVTGGTASTVDRYYCDGDVISESLNELADANGGFAWEIDVNGALQCYVGGRGSDLSATRTIAPATSTSWSDVADVTELATYVTGLGETDEDTLCGAPLVVDFTAERTTYGRKERVISGDYNTEAEMDRVTSEELRARVASRCHIANSWIEGRGPWSFGTVWLGDVVKAQRGTELGGDLNVRLINISITFEDRYEFVSMEWEAA